MRPWQALTQTIIAVALGWTLDARPAAAEPPPAPSPGMPDYAAVIRLYNVGGTAPFIRVAWSCSHYYGQSWFGDPEAIYLDRTKKTIWTCAEKDEVLYQSSCPNDQLGTNGCAGS